MSSVDIAVADKPKQIDTRVNRIQGRLKAALDKMVWEGLPYDEAARELQFTVSAMRKALNRPHVLAYLNSERQVLRVSVSPRNIHRLVEIRDAADNMPAVQAIKVLEELGDQQQQRGSAVNAAPGITIRVVTINQAAPANAREPVTVIDAQAVPAIDHEPTGEEK